LAIAAACLNPASAGGGELVAWVKVPQVAKSDSQNTVIYMYYGNECVTQETESPSNVWDDDYVGVWHLSNDSFVDSTGNGNTGSNSGTSNTTAQIADGRSFDASTDDISLGTSSTLQPANLTFSFWVRRPTGTSWSDVKSVLSYCKGVWDQNGWYVESYDVSDADRPLNLVVDANKGFNVTGIDPDTFYPENTWTYIVITFNSSTNAGAAYKNAVSQTFTDYSTPDSITSTPDTKYIGHSDNSLVGDMDEVRVSSTVRSDDWIKTEYNNQNDPGDVGDPGFYTVGGQVTMAECSDTFAHRRQITIDPDMVSGTADLENFPYLVSIEMGVDEHWLKWSGAHASGHVESEYGYDIVFRAADEETYLDHEIEEYDGTNGKLVAWVRIPTLDHDDNTIIYMYYGTDCITQATENPEDVWDDNYEAVWHLHETPTNGGTHYDSTSNNKDGTFTDTDGDSDTDAIGKIDGADDFNGDADYISAPQIFSGSIDGTSLTYTAWIKIDSFTPEWGAVVNQGQYNYEIALNETPNAIVLSNDA
jgi:hypothetical protein